jgi:hypothetical protein
MIVAKRRSTTTISISFAALITLSALPYHGRCSGKAAWLTATDPK